MMNGQKGKIVTFKGVLKIMIRPFEMFSFISNCYFDGMVK